MACPAKASSTTTLETQRRFRHPHTKAIMNNNFGESSTGRGSESAVTRRHSRGKGTAIRLSDAVDSALQQALGVDWGSKISKRKLQLRDGGITLLVNFGDRDGLPPKLELHDATTRSKEKTDVWTHLTKTTIAAITLAGSFCGSNEGQRSIQAVRDTSQATFTIGGQTWHRTKNEGTKLVMSVFGAPCGPHFCLDIDEVKPLVAFEDGALAVSRNPDEKGSQDESNVGTFRADRPLGSGPVVLGDITLNRDILTGGSRSNDKHKAAIVSKEDGFSVVPWAEYSGTSMTGGSDRSKFSAFIVSGTIKFK